MSMAVAALSVSTSFKIPPNAIVILFFFFYRDKKTIRFNLNFFCLDGYWLFSLHGKCYWQLERK